VALRDWGLGRVTLAWLGYWLLLAASGLARLLQQLNRMRRDGSGGALIGVGLHLGPGVALLLLGPPILLTVVWLWTRRR